MVDRHELFAGAIVRRAREISADQKACERERKAQEKGDRDAARTHQDTVDTDIRTGDKVVTSRLGQNIARGIFGTLIAGGKGR